MAREVDVPLGELFVLLILTRSELRTSGSREQYQQLVVFNIIKEFRFDIEVIVRVPPLACFEINRGNSLFPIVTGPERCPVQPSERAIHPWLHPFRVREQLLNNQRGAPVLHPYHQPPVSPSVATTVKHSCNICGLNHKNQPWIQWARGGGRITKGKHRKPATYSSAINE